MASSKIKGITIEIGGNTTKCGVDIRVNEHGECKYCNLVILNGEHSWVLSKISDSYVN